MGDPESSATKEEEMRHQLGIYLSYLQLMTSLNPTTGGIENEDVREGLTEAWVFWETSNAEEFAEKGPELLDVLEKQVGIYTRLAEPRVPLEEICREYDELCKRNGRIWKQGIEYGWLQELMDCSNMGIPEDYPLHARIGVGVHAGFGSVEEEFLLRDAFFMLVLAEESYSSMHRYSRCVKESKEVDNYRLVKKKLGSVNQNVGTYSRLCILSFFAFVEAFVNSVGYEFIMRHGEVLSPKDVETLRGRKGERYLSLDEKVEKFPQIIGTYEKTPLDTSSYKRLRESLKSFRDHIWIRHSSVHYSPEKEAIWREPDDWTNMARSISRLCMEVSVGFWKSCYPDKREPEYLGRLDYDRHLGIARKRMEIRDETKGE